MLSLMIKTLLFWNRMQNNDDWEINLTQKPQKNNVLIIKTKWFLETKSKLFSHVLY